MSKPVILTGLRANNDLHIGNYLGALLPLVDMAKSRAGDYQINLFVPDLHSFTTPIDHGSLQAAITQNLRVFAAAGLPLDHDDVFLYRQSYIPAHSELTWILDCFTGFGEMSRMTQFKDKRDVIKVEGLEDAVANNEHNDLSDEAFDQAVKARYQTKVSVGLFNYPVLMAADMLLYGAEYIPVGDDQTQHLEFTRDIAERMNKRFGELFVVPKPVKEQHEFFGKDQGLRIRDLQNPTKKMSKSDESSKGIIFLTDTPEAVRQKIMSAETDSFGEIQHDYDKHPGVSNLLDLLKLLGGQPNEFIGQNQYGPLKEAVATKVGEFLTDFQAKLAAVDEAALTRKLEAGEAQMNETANATLLKVQKAVGLRP
ncbi:MAG TPA: tryptophan--tRNA ligase [Candidatus Saccharimonadales bacterium]